jgi:hypothetical protein
MKTSMLDIPLWLVALFAAFVAMILDVMARISTGSYFSWGDFALLCYVITVAVRIEAIIELLRDERRGR